MEANSFSEAFLLSINCPSGIALAFRILYLSQRYSSNSFKLGYVTDFVHVCNPPKQQKLLPLPEIAIEDPAGEALPADPDPFQYTITAQLVKDQVVIHGPLYGEIFPIRINVTEKTH